MKTEKEIKRSLKGMRKRRRASRKEGDMTRVKQFDEQIKVLNWMLED